MLLQIGVCLMLVCLCMILWFSHRLTDSLRRLEKRMSCVRDGDFDVRFFYPYHDEVGSLAKSFNYMIGEIQNLVQKQEETIEELRRERDRVEEMQKQKRRAELRALQAQINPHFLYNTLNAITWQAADQGAEEISILSNSLGRFFRLSLSKGAEVILLKDEVEHVTSYLDIQSIRYRSKIQYQISIPKEWMMQSRIIKLVLQPLAENSIYHGIKEKTGSGIIKISAEKEQWNDTWVLHLIVWDDGLGISPERLESINASLSRGEIDRNEGYGIYNVNERILLYYGESYGLRYESEEGKWTKAILTIPFTCTDNEP
ncbi:MAG: sensor histidine kinase [bacterium]|nr:sensor histidine kinase [bacterium]